MTTRARFSRSFPPQYLSLASASQGGDYNLLGDGQTNQPPPPGSPDGGGTGGTVSFAPLNPGVMNPGPGVTVPPAPGGTSWTPIVVGAGAVLALLYFGRNEKKKRR
jgi:hypothetical protein